jgi:phosphoglycolate phosphatase
MGEGAESAEKARRRRGDGALSLGWVLSSTEAFAYAQSMVPPTAIVFDLDGTLIDSRGDIVAAVNHALLHAGRSPLPAPLIVRYVGDGARSLCARAAQLPEMDEEVDHLLAMFVDYYVQHPVDFTRWAPGARETLDALTALEDMTLALCTNKPRATTDAVLSALGVRTHFQVIVAGGDLMEKKPSPGPLLHIAKVLRTPADAMVMVGDGPQDIECARRAKMRSIAVDSGFFPTDRIRQCNPDVFVRTLFEVVDVIQRWRDATERNYLPAEKLRQ